jgi:hypothetical protein
MTRYWDSNNSNRQTSSSPELVAKLGQDYTVYAYDYSEYETPLVGQGMLSWALASASAALGGSSPQRQMITGRVCTNTLGIFSNGVKETLEVKLRLVKVPTCLQSEYLNSMNKYRELSKVIPTDFDAAAWTAYLQQNPELDQLAEKVKTSDRRENPGQMGAGDIISQLLSQGLLSAEEAQNDRNTLQNQTVELNGTSASLPTDGAYSRTGSPSLGPRSNQLLMQPSRGTYSRPPSRPQSRNSRDMAINQNVEANGSYAQNQMQHPASRTGSPALRQDSAPPPIGFFQFSQGPSRPPSRPQSRADSIVQHERANLEDSRRASLDSNQVIWDDFQRSRDLEETTASGTEEGPARKRIRTTQVDWRGKSAFGASSGMLRVAASEAASVRVVRPIAMKPSPAGQVSLEEPPRAPTPRPFGTNENPSRKRLQSNSGLRRESLNQDNADRSVRPSIETAAPSPNFISFQHSSSALTDITSSPPPLSQMSPAPSSPVLPSMPRDTPRNDFDDLTDAGNDTDIGGDDDIAETPMSDQNRPSQPPQVVDETTWHEVNPGPKEHLPTKIIPYSKPPPRQVKKTQAAKQSRSLERQSSVVSAAAGGSPGDGQSPQMNQSQAGSNGLLDALKDSVRTSPPPTQKPRQRKPISRVASSAALQRSQIPASDPIRPPPGLQRSQTWTGNDNRPLHPASEGPGQDRDPVTGRKNRNGSGIKRKKAVQNRLMEAIEAGEIPPYCENCGAIETPTWRKAFAKIVEGSLTAEVEAAEGQSYLLVEELEKDDDGKILRTRVIKKSKDPVVDVGFKEFQMCNPCGIWMKNHKSWRPQSRWDKDTSQIPKKKRRRAGKKPLGDPSATSELNLPSEMVNLEDDDGSSPAEMDLQPAADDGREPTLPLVNGTPVGNEAAKDKSLEVSLQAQLAKAIQSSPARFLANQPSPVELPELGQTRRLLFPSPRKAGVSKSLDEIADEPTPSQGADAAKDTAADSESDSEQPDSVDKENCPPEKNAEDDLNSLFDEAEETPTTPKSAPVDHRFKTPAARTPSGPHLPSPSPWRSDIFSSANRALLFPQTPQRSLPVNDTTESSPFTAQLAALLSDANAPPMSGDLDVFDDMDVDQDGFLADFDHEDLMVTKGAMPSSPPPFFSLYEDPTEPSSNLWSDYNLPASPNTSDPVGAYGSIDLGHATGKDGGTTANAVPTRIQGSEVTMSSSSSTMDGLTVDFSAFIDDVAKQTSSAGSGAIRPV